MANVGMDYIEAYVPLTLLVALEGQPGVLRVETIIPPHPNVTSQGTMVHRSPVWNAGGFTGAGVKVGIIDVGFIGYGSLMGTELPYTVVARCYTAVGTFSSTLASCETDDEHGTAVAEAVVDIAPDASLYIANPISSGDLQSTASWMVGQGVQVINHSVGWTWQGPGDGTSPFSNSALGAVDIAVAGGAIWMNAAGNSAQESWFGGYSDTDSDGFLEFSGIAEANGVQLSAGDGFTAQLRWDDSWGNAARDFDLLLLDSSLALVASSVDRQFGGPGHYPREKFVFTAPASDTYFLVIGHFAGAVPSWLQLNSFRGPDLQFSVASTSIANPAENANTGMLAVGAANWATPDTIESFSSQGPTTDGRVKPDIVGADNGDSVSYSGPCFGTSQASPHVAGLAALVLERFPAFTPTQVADYLKANAIPRNPVPNNTWGYGLAQLPSLAPTPPTNVVATAGNSQATVTWDAPASDGGSAITSYTVTASPSGIAATSTPPALTSTVFSLTNGTSYTFTVTATNAIGTSAPAAPSNAVTPVAAPTPTPTGTLTPTPTPTPIPGTTSWGLGVMAALMAIVVLWRGRRREPG